MCQVLAVSKSGYYRWKSRQTDPEEASLKDLIKAIYAEHRGRYGYRRIYKEIKRRGLKVNHKRVSRLMRSIGLKGIQKKAYKKTTDSNHKNTVSENLLEQNFNTEDINLVWLSDITGIKTFEGWLYLAVVMDLYSRRILGWELSESLEKEVVIAALRKALRTYSPNGHLIFHSDRGVQFTSYEFREMLERFGIKQSMSGKGNCYDNAPMESLFHSLKTELLLANCIETKYATRAEIFEYLEVYYNKKRLHSSLQYRTPDEVFFERKI